jgi:hypothetical protein
LECILQSRQMGCRRKGREIESSTPKKKYLRG